VSGNPVPGYQQFAPAGVSLQSRVDLSFLGRWFGSESERAGALGPLLSPLDEFLSRSAKQIRARLVVCGFELARSEGVVAHEQHSLLQALATWVEALHAGSLVIDDIQDLATTRRGLPALHALMGEAAAINAANWLYFWPTQLLQRESLRPELELELYRVYHSTMTRAHYGQALDLAFDMTQVPQNRALSISMAAIELKTGALMAMCSELGAIAAGADAGMREVLSDFGRSFGASLQMFNDLEDFKRDPASGRVTGGPWVRPSWVWATAARLLGPAEFSDFQEKMKQPSVGMLVDRVLDEARIGAKAALESCIDGLGERFAGHPGLESVRELAFKLLGANRA
jgi:hypothetical protein